MLACVWCGRRGGAFEFGSREFATPGLEVPIDNLSQDINFVLYYGHVDKCCDLLINSCF